MGFRGSRFNDTVQISDKGIWNMITGRRNAIFLRNKYQTELDNANAALVDMAHYCEDKNVELKETFNKAEGIKAAILAHEKEREQAYAALGNLLNTETNFEKTMYEGTVKAYDNISRNQQARTINVKQRGYVTDNEQKFASMLKYMEKYPEYQTKSSFKNTMYKIQEKEKEIRYAKIDKEKAISEYHNNLQIIKIYIQKAKDKLDAYNRIYNEGEIKLKGTRYINGIFYKFTSAKKADEVNLDTLKHRIQQWENTLKIIENDISQYQGRQFVELSRE